MAIRQDVRLPVLLIAAVFGCARGSDRAAPAACALSGQTPEPGPFDPNQVEFIANPQPLEVDGRSVVVQFHWIARVLGLRPLIFEILDSDDERGSMSGPCERVRVYSVAARLNSVLQALRFHDLVKATMSFTEGAMGTMVLTELATIQGAPVYLHEQARKGACINRTGTLVQYYKHSGETVVISNDGGIYLRDSDWRVFDRQRLGPEELREVMQALGGTGFNEFKSQKWDVGDISLQPYVALACGRFQKVLIPDHEQALAPMRPLMERVKAKALAQTYYVLMYQEKREITFLDWPFPQMPLDQVEDLKREARSEEQEARSDNRPARGEFAVVRQQLPSGFFARLPLNYTPMKPDEDPNRDVYFKDGLRIFRVAKNPNAGPDAGTVYALTVKESVSAEKALAGFPMPRDGESSMSYLASDPGACGSLWPEGMGVELRQVSPQGLPISNEEYAKHARLYFDLQHTENGGLTGRGASIVEGRFLYTNVRLTRLERDRP